MTLSNRPPFALVRDPLELRFRRTVLSAREWITPDYVRARVTGEELAGFGSELGVDMHIRIFFPADDAETVEEYRAGESREFTPLAWGDDWLDLEFAVHGDEGIAGRWAADAPIGAKLGVGGPRGAMRFEGQPDAWLLAGDESALAQIRRYAAVIPAGVPARILLEVRDADHEIPVDAPVPVEYIHRGDAPTSCSLIARISAIGAEERPAGEVFAFIAGEQGIVRPGRELALDRWGLDPERIVIKGYWKA